MAIWLGFSVFTVLCVSIISVSKLHSTKVAKIKTTTMEKNRRINYNKLTLTDRVRVMKAYKVTPVYTHVASQFNCSASQVKNIVKNKRAILKRYVRTKEFLASKDIQSESTVNSQVMKLLEMVLYEWFQRAQRHVETGPITNELILEKAEEIKQIFCMKDFNADINWLLLFRTKYDITDLDMTMLMIANAEPKALDMNEIAGYVVDNNPILEDLERSPAESISELIDSDFEMDNKDKDLSSKVIEISSCSSDDESTVSDGIAVENNNNGNNGEAFKTQSQLQPQPQVINLVEPEPTIMNDEQARLYLRPLEDYALINENFRAIGLIEKLLELFKK